MGKAATAVKLKSFSQIGVFKDKAARKQDAAHVRSPEGARQWLELQIELGKAEIFSVRQVLTEPLARELLERNPGNRTVQKTAVGAYVRAMKNGVFQSDNGQAIIISREGLLNDGQHRLEARLIAGVDLPFLFTFGVDRVSRETLDQGRNRNAKDFLAMKGYTDGWAVVGAAVMLHEWRRVKKVKMHSDDRIGTSEIAKYAEANYQQIAASARLIPRAGATSNGGLAVLSFCHLICAELDLEVANDFFTRLVNGNDLPKDSPILALSLRLRKRERLTRPERVELIFRAWNAHREKRTMSVIPILKSIPDPV